MYSRGACAGELARPTLEPRKLQVLRRLGQPMKLRCLRQFAQRNTQGCQVVVPGVSREPPLVEAGGQYIHGFRRGLDYAFIRPLTERMDAERVIPLIESVGS